MLPESEESSSVELTSTAPVHTEKAINGTHLQSISEETEFVITNGHADMTDGDKATLLEAQPEVDFQVPPYILEQHRFGHHYAPSSRASQVMPDEDDLSCDSTEYFGEVTQITDLSVISNENYDSTSDISDGELTHL